MTLPVVHLTGTSYEQGVTHGRVLKDRIAHNLDVYFTRFTGEVGIKRDDVHRLAAHHVEGIVRLNPEYAAGMEGIAEGSGFDRLDIAVLNVRYEILYYLYGQAALLAAQAQEKTDGCTAFAALPEATASGHLILGQNWDWIPEVQGAVLHTTEADGFEVLAYTEAGIVGAKIGLNSAGLGLCINGMTTVGDDWARTVRPFHVRCYEMLRSRTLEAARRVVTDEPRAIAGNFLLAQVPDQIVDIEAAPDKANLLGCEGGACLLTHANHFVDPEGIGVEEPPNPRRIFSKRRAARLGELLNGRLPLTVEGIQDALRDTQDDPFGLCRHRDLTVGPEQHYTTVVSVVMDLNDRVIHLTDGAPDEAPYQTAALSDPSE